MTDFDLALVLWHYHNVGVDPKRCDLILGLGSYDLRVADHCAVLYQAGIAEQVVFSGASGNWTRKLWDSSEAEIFGARAIGRGVPEEALFRECEATNIAENLTFTRRMFSEQARDIKSVTIVTKPNTLRRVRACLPLQWPDVVTYLTSPPLTLESQITRQRSLSDLINEMVGDFQRIMVYPSMGYSISQESPPEVVRAYYSLIEKGYVEHLMPDQPLPVRGQ